MKKIIYSFFLAPFFGGITAQTCSLDSVTALSSTVLETSGLIYFDGKLVTHNDSGDNPNLYEINTTDGSVTRTVTISNATNVDWEDIAQDDDYIYIGDFGNNNGTRGDLMIYVISKADFNAQTTVTADTIQFQYAEQIDFTSHPKDTDFDCEAMVVVDDSILLFTKNWVNEKTNLYKMPKVSGFYTLSISDSLDAQGTVTGATYNADKNSIFLVGYQSANPFMWELAQFSGYNPFSGTNSRCALAQPSGTSIQIEAITSIGNDGYYISSEEFNYGNFNLPSYLSIFQKEYTAINSLTNSKLKLYPNPVSDVLNIQLTAKETIGMTDLRIVNVVGKTVYQKSNLKELKNEIDISKLAKGSYYVIIKNDKKIDTISFIKN